MAEPKDVTKRREKPEEEIRRLKAESMGDVVEILGELPQTREEDVEEAIKVCNRVLNDPPSERKSPPTTVIKHSLIT